MTQGPPEIPHFDFRADIGGGGFAMVYRYYHRVLKRDVAVKVPKGTDLSADLRDRFLEEGQSMAELGHHPNVVTVYDTGTAADGRPYLVMEYYEGGDLANIAARSPLPVKQVLDIGVRVAGAIETAHERRIVHRDIKPANVLMSKVQPPQPHLTDFGIAGHLARGEDGGQVALSVPWSAPELLDRTRTAQAGIATEVFSFGATLWHLLVGHSPFMPPGADNTQGAIERRILSGWLPTGRLGSADLERLLLRAMATDPAARPRSIGELAVGLQTIQRAHRFGVTDLVLMPAPELEPVARPVITAPSFAAPSPAPSLPTTKRKQEELKATLVREKPPSPPVPVEPEPPVRLRWPFYVAGGAAVAVIVGIGLFLLSGQEKPGSGPAVTTVADDGGDQSAGSDGAPPGKPAITATRVDANAVQFAWNYSSQQATDTFSWRTSDGARTGVATEPSVRLDGAKPVCLQVKVVRKDGSNATADWSPETCG